MMITPMDPSQRQYEHSLRQRMTATHCCVCCATLDDAKSVELGVGPVCRKRYARPQMVVTDDMLQTALGYMAASPLPAEFVQEALAHKWNAQQVCNILVKFCSVHYHNKQVVFAITPIIRALGYTNLAARLEEDRTAVRIKAVVDDRFELYAPYSASLTTGLRKVPGAQMVRHASSGRFKCWSFPKAHEALTLAILGIFHGGKDASGDNGVFVVKQTTWGDVRALQTAAPQVKVSAAAQGIRLESTERGTTVEVYTPYDATFVQSMHAIRFRWNGLKKCWYGPMSKRDSVVAAVKRCYGVEPEDGWDD